MGKHFLLTGSMEKTWSGPLGRGSTMSSGPRWPEG